MAIKLIQLPHRNGNVKLRFATGHFATSHSHLNYYIDMTMTKHRLSEAREAAAVLCSKFNSSTVIDTILCLDQLTRAGYMNMNAHRTIYVATPEHVSGSQLIFRDNTAPMIVGKHVLVLAASVATGYTAQAAIEAIRYYGGIPVGVCSIFACVESCEGFPVESIYNKNDLDGYASYASRECPLCKAGVKLDAMVNSYGISSF